MDPRVKFASKILAAGNAPAARKVLNERLHVAPNDPDALYVLARAQHQQGELANAETTFRTLLAVRPRHPQALYGLGSILAQTNRPADARQAFAAALAVDPSMAQARKWVERLDRQAQPAPDGDGGGGGVAKRRKAGELLQQGHRSLSSYIGRFVGAAGLAVLGMLVGSTYQEGRLRWFTERPPLQWPSIDFLRDRFETTGQEVHRQELERALARSDDLSDLLDKVYGGTSVVLVLVAFAIAVHAVLASMTTSYSVYERRIDLRKGVLFRRRSDAWLFRVTNTEYRQSPFQRLGQTAEIRVFQEPRGQAKPALWKDRSMMKIVGFGTLEQQDDLYEQLKEVALGERVEMKRTFV